MDRKKLRIRQVIGVLCITQKEAAELCGITPQAFSRIANGQEPAYPKRGQRIADALGWERPWQELFEEVEISPLNTVFDNEGNVVRLG